MPKKRFVSGVVDPITVIGVLFLIITLSIGTYVVSDKKYNFNIFERAGLDGGLDTLSGNSSGQNTATVSNTNSTTYIQYTQPKIKNSDDDSNDNPPAQPASTAAKPKFADGCDVNGTKLEVGSNVVGGANIAGTNFKGTSGYATCDANLGWVDCLTCNDQNLTVLPIYIENELEAACSNSGKTWDDVSKTCNDSQTQANNTPITIGQQDANAPYISLSDTVRDVEVKNNNLMYQQQQIIIDPKTITTNSNSLSGVNIGGGTSSTGKNVTSNQVLPYVPITWNQVNDLIMNIGGMEWYNYIKNQSGSSPNLLVNFPTNVNTNNQTPENPSVSFSNSISATNTTGNFCGKPGLSQEQQEICTNIARATAYNSPITGGYLQAFSNPNNIFQWQQLGYSSSEMAIQDCISQNGIGSAFFCMKQMNGYGKSQVTSSVSLGTDIASVITLPAAPAIFGTKSLLMFGLGTFGGTMTVQQTKNAVVAQIVDPGFFKTQEDINPVGFWESIDPQTYLTDAGYQTTMAALGWFNLDSANKLMRAWGPAGNALLQQSARVYNTVVSTANLYVDTPYAVNKCTQSGLISSECGYASIAPVFDVVFGGLDYYQGQLTLNPIRAITETVDSLAPSLVNGLRNNPLGEIQIPTKFNTSQIPIEYSLSGLDGQIGGWPTNFDNVSTYIKNEPYLPNSNNGDMLFSPYQQYLSSAEVNEIELTREQIENLTVIEIQNLNPTPKLALTEPDPNITAQIDLNSSEGNIPRNIQVAPEVVSADEVGRTTTQISWRGFMNEVGQLQFPIQTRQITIDEIVPPTAPLTTRIENWIDQFIPRNIYNNAPTGPRVFDIDDPDTGGIPLATTINIPRPIISIFENYIYTRTGGLLPFINNIIVPNRIFDPNFTLTTPMATRIGDWANRATENNPTLNKIIARIEDMFAQTYQLNGNVLSGAETRIYLDGSTRINLHTLGNNEFIPIKVGQPIPGLPNTKVLSINESLYVYRGPEGIGPEGRANLKNVGIEPLQKMNTIYNSNGFWDAVNEYVESGNNGNLEVYAIYLVKNGYDPRYVNYDLLTQFSYNAYLSKNPHLVSTESHPLYIGKDKTFASKADTSRLDTNRPADYIATDTKAVALLQDTDQQTNKKLDDSLFETVYRVKIVGDSIPIVIKSSQISPVILVMGILTVGVNSVDKYISENYEFEIIDYIKNFISDITSDKKIGRSSLNVNNDSVANAKFDDTNAGKNMSLGQVVTIDPRLTLLNGSSQTSDRLKALIESNDSLKLNINYILAQATLDYRGTNKSEYIAFLKERLRLNLTPQQYNELINKPEFITALNRLETGYNTFNYEDVQCLFWGLLTQGLPGMEGAANIDYSEFNPDVENIFGVIDNLTQQTVGNGFASTQDVVTYNLYAIYPAGQNTAYHFNDSNQGINGPKEGDAYFIKGKNHVGRILEIYLKPNGEKIFVVAESNRTGDGEPGIYVLTEQEFIDTIGIRNTWFLRDNNHPDGTGEITQAPQELLNYLP